MVQRSFTIHQVNAIVPRLEDIFAAIDVHRTTWSRHYQKLQILDALWGKAVRKSGNPDYEEYIAARGRLQQASKDIDAVVQHDLLNLGLRFPSGGLEHGIVDFPSTYQGRWIYLCWQRGESRLTHWHEIDAGFQGRQPITDEHVIEMGRLDAELPDGLPDESALDY